tara:strand:- start:334 stop:507 length:174 start_codon:yes stop_codon:yes gene_type:complete
MDLNYMVEKREVSADKGFTDEKSEFIQLEFTLNENCECFQIEANWHKTVKVRVSEKN